jgi:hypothetical protein
MLTLMIGHVNVAGAQLSNGQPSIGHEIELNPKHLDRLGDIPKLLNHIHKPQTIAGAHYAGSVCRLDYGEIEEKRYSSCTSTTRTRRSNRSRSTSRRCSTSTATLTREGSPRRRQRRGG